jgi:hypothetical protein
MSDSFTRPSRWRRPVASTGLETCSATSDRRSTWCCGV